MSSFAKLSATDRPGRPMYYRDWLTLSPAPDRDDQPVHPSVWIMLADDALRAGRIGQSEELIEEAYLAYDEATTSASISVLGSVRRLHEGLQSFLSKRRMDARRRKASALWLRFSQSLASRRQRLSQAIVRSTIQRWGRTTKPLARSQRRTISVIRPGMASARPSWNTGPA